MSRTGRTLFTATLLSALLAACGSEPGPTQPSTAVEESSQLDESAEGLSTDSELAACTASARCGDCTTVTCSGVSTCSGVDGPTGAATCDGVATSCRMCPFRTQSYADGTTYAGTCASNRCTGPLVGNPCLNAAQCVALCCNGTWYLE